jgi:UDP:flavonoid glycosyltransferase YjiC (YdhE family)
MRLLIVAGGSPATVFALAPLGCAMRLAGHEVLVAAPEDMIDYVTASGLPSVAVTKLTMTDFMFFDRSGNQLDIPQDPAERMLFNGRGFGRFASASLPPLYELVKHWRPDLVVGGALCYAAHIVSAHANIPFVRHTWDLGEPVEIDAGAVRELGPELDSIGATDLPTPDLWVDICPPKLRSPTLAPGPRCDQRFIPYNRQRSLEQWMWHIPRRRRVAVTAGSRVSDARSIEELVKLVDSIAGLDAEIVVASPEPIAARLREIRNVRAGWLPLDALLPTCSAVVHHGGGQTTLNALASGVPQVFVPTIPKMVEPCSRVAGTGAAVTIAALDQNPKVVASAVENVLEDSSYQVAAQSLRRLICEQPTPLETVTKLEKLFNVAR